MKCERERKKPSRFFSHLVYLRAPVATVRRSGEASRIKTYIYKNETKREDDDVLILFSLVGFFYDFYVIFFALWRVRSSPSPSRSCAGRIPSRILAHLEGLEARKIDFIDPFAK